MKTNVVHLVDDLKIGGLERTLAIVVENLDKAKYNVSVWCLIGGGRIADKLRERGFEVKILKLSTSTRIHSLLRLTWRLRKEKVKILHCWGISGGVWGRFASILAGVPIRFVHVQNLHYDLKRKGRLIEYFLSFFTDRIIACSEAVKKCLIEFIGIKKHKIETIYNSIEIQKFNRTSNSQTVRNEFNLDIKDIVIGNVSRLVPVKGHYYLLEAVAKILKEFPQVKLLLVGDGPLRKDLEAKAEELGIKGKVIFTGLREDIPRLLSIMDIFVLPSVVKEGLPLAVAEAEACALVVVATDIGGNSEVVKDKETGLLIPPGDVQSLTKSLIFLLKNPQRAKQMGEAGRRLCEERFSSDMMMQKMHHLYSLYAMKTKD